MGRMSAKEYEERQARRLHALSALPARMIYRMAVKAYFRGGYVATRYFHNRGEMRDHIEKRLTDDRINYVGVIPPQDYKADRMEREADKGGYNIEKYQKVFGK